jgi:VanZ family protein
MALLIRSPRVWLAGFLVWFSVLWLLSGSSQTGDYTPPFPNFDKVAHFGYFFGGSGLLCAYLFRRAPDHPNWGGLISVAVIIVGLIGGLDEWHQSFTPGRSGNDPADLLADVLGAAAGAFTFKRIHHRLQ